MPPRPAKSKHTANRLSAVYIGPNPTSALQQASSYYSSPPAADITNIPDLPEPPSPGASSNGSGLPSPPATNSTGSGSTGDPQSIAIRQRPLSLTSSSSDSPGGSLAIRDFSSSMVKGSNARTFHRSTSSISSTRTRANEDGADADFDDNNGGEDGDYDNSHNNGNEEEEEGDDTARFDLRHSRATSSNENVLALQRVKSLTQRNRMALDKLSSYPRNGTPTSRSPVPSHTSSSASGSSTSKSTTSSRLSHPPRHSTSTSISQDQQLSGSETERESSSSFYSHSISNHSSSSSQTHLRSLSHHQTRTRTPPTPHRIRTRLPSAPSSPFKSLTRTNTAANAGASSSNPSLSTSSNGSSPSRRRKRVSLASSVHLMEDRDRERDFYGAGGAGRARSSLALVSPGNTYRERDVTQSALAAVASSRRRSSPGALRKRGALPMEFRGDLGSTGRLSAEPEPMTPYRTNMNGSGPPSASGSGLNRSATVREPRRGQSKWASEDLGSSTSSVFDSGSGRNGEHRRERRDSATGMIIGMGEYRERRQSLRGGSAESALSHGVGRTLVGEGLRAAGLSPSKSRFQRGTASGGGGGGGNGGEGDVFGKEQPRRVDWNRNGGGDDEYVDEDGRFSRMRAETLVGPRAGAATLTGTVAGRASTSMANYRYLGRADEEDSNGRRELRGSKSAFPLREGGRAESLTRQRETSLTREEDRSASSMSRYGPTRSQHLQDQQPQERYSSPFGSRRYNSLVPPASIAGSAAQQQAQEHTRLMMESLAMFEGHMARLGSSSGLGGGDLVRTAQGIAGAAERLNTMLRYGVARALEEQVDAEVEEGEGKEGARDMAELWRRVGGEYREGQRVSDDLVRGLTGFLLGVGKAVKELAAGGDPGQHGRSVSLDDDGFPGGRRPRSSASPDVTAGGPSSTAGGSGSGRRSVESGRSWEPTGDGVRDDVSRRLSSRADSSLGAARPPSAFNALRDRNRGSDNRYDTPPPPLAPTQKTGPRNSTGTTQSMRRLFTPREQREQRMDANLDNGRMATSDSQTTMCTDYEPSPTPAPRPQNQSNLDRSRTLPPLALPKPLPALPSESLRRSQTSSNKATPPSINRDRDRDRRKPSMASISTVRGNQPTFPASLTTPSSATTALTAHTVSTTHTPDKTTFPSLHRTDSEKSAHSTVTFSRPSTVSVSALNGLQQQHLEHQRKRTGSGASSGAEPSTSVPPQRTHVLSGSETERDTRRKTLGARAGRMSLDSDGDAGGSRTSTVHAADRSAAVVAAAVSGGMLPPMNTARRERRRTVTEIWPRE